MNLLVSGCGNNPQKADQLLLGPAAVLLRQLRAAFGANPALKAVPAGETETVAV